MARNQFYWIAFYVELWIISACNCNPQGSNGNDCDANGVCSCRANIVGNKCDGNNEDVIVVSTNIAQR